MQIVIRMMKSHIERMLAAGRLERGTVSDCHCVPLAMARQLGHAMSPLTSSSLESDLPHSKQGLSLFRSLPTIRKRRDSSQQLRHAATTMTSMKNMPEFDVIQTSAWSRAHINHGMKNPTSTTTKGVAIMNQDPRISMTDRSSR